MDPNFNLNQGVNTPGTYNVIQPPQNFQGTNVWTGNYPDFQQLQQLNAQLGTLNINNSGTNYLDAYMAIAQNSSASTPAGPFVITSVQSTPLQNQPVLEPGLINPTNQSFAPNGQVPVVPLPSFNNQLPPMMTPEQLAMYAHLQNNMMNAGNPPTVSGIPSVPKGTPVPVTVPGSVIQNQQQHSPGPLSPTSNGSMSEPHTPTTPRTPNTSRDSGKVLHIHLHDSGSTTSSSSMPGSPSSIGGHSLPENCTGSFSPEAEVFTNGDFKTGNVPIRSHSLKYHVKFPQDKCYKCLKKVYPMEKIGPVKEAVYHKGCFVCKICGTRLNMKNYFLNKKDTFDNDIYCKSHQPVSTGKGADSNSVLIKGAMSVPKLGKVNEQIRGDKDYHIDNESVEIVHARNVPAADLQSSNKIKEKAWKKEQRKSESAPPVDVVRYKDPVPEYDSESYERYLVENNPDYN